MLSNVAYDTYTTLDAPARPEQIKPYPDIISYSNHPVNEDLGEPYWSSTAGPVDNYREVGFPFGITLDTDTGIATGTPSGNSSANVDIYASNVFGEAINPGEFVWHTTFRPVPAQTMQYAELKIRAGRQYNINLGHQFWDNLDEWPYTYTLSTAILGMALTSDGYLTGTPDDSLIGSSLSQHISATNLTPDTTIGNTFNIVVEEPLDGENKMYYYHNIRRKALA